MTYRVVLIPGARQDLLRLYQCLDDNDPVAGAKARKASRRSFEYLANFSFNSRKATDNDPTLRKIIVPFGKAGYVALFEIHNEETAVILAARHQREADYFD